MIIDFTKKMILLKLRLLVGLYVRLKRVDVIAITGSAGKTTAKITMGQILSEKSIYVPKEAYNTEFGVPLAIFREKVPTNPRDLLAWTVVLLRMFGKLFLKSPYDRIVLEYGADKAGDIAYLTRLVHPHIVLVTTILPVHLEGFGDIKAVAKEKSALVECLNADDFAILNLDNPWVRKMAKKTRATVISFGSEKADLQYSDLGFNEIGMTLDVSWKGNVYQLHIPVAAPQLLPSYLGAFAVGLILGEDPRQMVKKFAHISPELGRMNVLAGLERSVIIDDSYNSNPESAKAALEVLAKYPGYKVAVLGSMNELGDYEEKGHVEVGEFAANIADEVIIVGEAASKYMYPVVLNKLDKKVVQKFKSSKEAGEYLAANVDEGNVYLFKGSQNGVFMEEAIKSVLAEPEAAGRLLVRQSPMWQKKKGINHG